MRIAVLADIHGNLAAFEAALDHAARQRIDRLLIVGDIVCGAADSAACWQLAQRLGCPMLRGNHERYVGLYGTPQADPRWSAEQFGPVRWAAGQLSPADRRALRDLPETLRLPDAPDVLFVHGSLRSDRDTIAGYTPEAELRAMFPGVAERLIVRGHNHLTQVRPWGQRLIVTVGSIGMALDGHPTAQYLILERQADGWDIQHQSAPYDLDATLARFEQSGYLAAAGPIARLYRREIATASSQIVPFLRMYAGWSRHESLSLSAAIDRFLQL